MPIQQGSLRQIHKENSRRKHGCSRMEERLDKRGSPGMQQEYSEQQCFSGNEQMHHLKCFEIKGDTYRCDDDKSQRRKEPVDGAGIEDVDGGADDSMAQEQD